MSTSNSRSGVGGTAQDGGMSTAATVSDGGPSQQKSDGDFVPATGAEPTEKAYVTGTLETMCATLTMLKGDKERHRREDE